ncbi:MAG: hypothetical protein JJU11_12405 [Candidatus Sumerlaeia bacterium]|nr:hypothetical protein [Candidatus Sumerlaeia bacterium]
MSPNNPARWFHLLAAMTVAGSLAACAHAEGGAVENGEEPADEDSSVAIIDNGIVRLGVDLDSGASIFFFAESETQCNLLNHFDRGRFIQQSFYGDKDGSAWGTQPWRWNPVQGGDYVGNPAILLDHSRTDTTIYTRSTPKNWAGGEDVTDTVMESWITLDGNIAHLRYRFVYTGDHEHEARHQEMPAVFVDYDLAELVHYTGDEPWTNGPLTRVVPGWPNEYHETTEHWSAYVNDADWGLGVYTPGTSELTAYRYRGSSGPDGRGTSYFSPIRTLAITPGIVIEYDVYLTIGTLKEIRERFHEISNGGGKDEG